MLHPAAFAATLTAALALAAPLPVMAAPAATQCPWTAAWGSSQMPVNGDDRLPEAARRDVTLRQIVRPSIAGSELRIRLSNAFGEAPLVIESARLARAASPQHPALTAGSSVPLRFAGKERVVVPAGADWLSDPVRMPVAAFDDLAVSLHFAALPVQQTGHPGSRATSYWLSGDRTSDTAFAGAATTDHWYMLSGVEMRRCGASAIVALGDSITDGRGSTTNGNDRWTDVLARRLSGKSAVVNQGIGGNRVLLDGTGPNAVARFDRDVLSVHGVTDLIVLEGINDIGMLTRDAPATPEVHAALVAGVTAAYRQIVERAHARGIKVYGGTLLPFMGMEYYHPAAASEADRQAINAWIRTPGHFDAVIDFDAAMRDPARPDHLNPAYDGGDAIHPNPAGYKAMGEAVSLQLLK
ncbi:SGNH/GDSL hydrolase family protein [Novosphingobium resinovorum]|nr:MULTISPECIES: SGNH/GDSL hydrolase family protein [Novosphingobium]MBF7014849.1 SGNH/GDSL hydrolase family protein [Novosphingobium sp. HR1a]WJM26318.1 SGNH/GDSL hydrolase family protein [Novosphingobium resinovorum]